MIIGRTKFTLHQPADLPLRTHIESASLSNQSSSYGRSCSVSHNNVLPVSSRETLLESAHSFIAWINEKRAEDIKLMGDFRNAMEIQAGKVCDFLQQEMIAIYDNDTHQIQVMLNELFATLDRIRDIEVEFLQFKEAFQVLFQQLQQDD
ncbi:uncharacterized protein LOC135471578 isoform X2 [Liolophura sinensis]|uniref:uncharacterized protein LOC135471578 isoform X2 n=1 Tax=Liolophura sinensis TaxID=3198878 RepID=UPI003157F2BD